MTTPIRERRMHRQGNHILLIDHDPERCALSENVLVEGGFAVTAVAEGLSAIRTARRRRFALAVAALDLPGSLDGATTLRHLRAGQPWLKALFVGPQSPLAWAPEREGDEFIAAPLQPRNLLGCVFELMQRHLTPDGGHSRAG